MNARISCNDLNRPVEMKMWTLFIRSCLCRRTGDHADRRLLTLHRALQHINAAD
jgi:hypothetical protein